MDTGAENFDLDWATCDRARVSRNPDFDGVFLEHAALTENLAFSIVRLLFRILHHSPPEGKP